jgi:hypothetical protein
VEKQSRTDQELALMVVAIGKARRASRKVGDDDLYDELGEVLDFLAEVLSNDYSAH